MREANTLIASQTSEPRRQTLRQFPNQWSRLLLCWPSYNFVQGLCLCFRVLEVDFARPFWWSMALEVDFARPFLMERWKQGAGGGMELRSSMGWLPNSSKRDSSSTSSSDVVLNPSASSSFNGSSSHSEKLSPRAQFLPPHTISWKKGAQPHILNQSSG